GIRDGHMTGVQTWLFRSSVITTSTAQRQSSIASRTWDLRIRNPLVDSLPTLAAAFENAPPSHRRTSWPRHAHPASLFLRTAAGSSTSDISGFGSAYAWAQ